MDARWARTPPARLARSVVQYGVVVPLLRFIAPTSVAGRQHLQGIRPPAVFVANHQSHADTPVCLSALGGRIRRRLVVAAAADYFYKNKLFGAFVSLSLGTVPFVRQGQDSRASLDLLKSLVGQGWSVLMFPSGTRGAVSGFKRGFAYVAVDQGVPVVPLYLSGPERILPKGSAVPLPGGVALGIGRPLDPGTDYDDLLHRTEDSMAGLREAIRRFEAA